MASFTLLSCLFCYHLAMAYAELTMSPFAVIDFILDTSFMGCFCSALGWGSQSQCPVPQAVTAAFHVMLEKSTWGMQKQHLGSNIQGACTTGPAQRMTSLQHRMIFYVLKTEGTSSFYHVIKGQSVCAAWGKWREGVGDSPLQPSRSGKRPSWNRWASRWSTRWSWCPVWDHAEPGKARRRFLRQWHPCWKVPK